MDRRQGLEVREGTENTVRYEKCQNCDLKSVFAPKKGEKIPLGQRP